MSLSGEAFDARLHPSIRQLAQLPELVRAADPAVGFTADEAERLRAQQTLPPQDLGPDVTAHDVTIPRTADGSEFRAKVYEPSDRSDGALPVVLYLHGGGYMAGTLESGDLYCARLVRDVHCIVVSPDYRLAPEHRYPAGVDDCYTALEWIAAPGNDLRADATRIAVGGASAGGGLTLAVCLMARDRNGPAITFQFPIYPTCDDRVESISNSQFDDPRFLSGDAVRSLWPTYLGPGYDTEQVSAYAAPARATDWSNLPACCTFVGELDPHRDETIDVVRRLGDAGVQVGFALYTGMVHGFDVMVPDAPASEQSFVAVAEAVTLAFRTPPPH